MPNSNMKYRARKGGFRNRDGKHYWLTPPDLMRELKKEFKFTFDACPYPRPKGYDSLKENWGKSTYVNPPFKKLTGWIVKAIEEQKKGKTVVLVLPFHRWLLRLIEAGAEIRPIWRVKWEAIEDREPGTSRPALLFILRGKK